MEIKNFLHAENRDEFRAWLEEHSRSETECRLNVWNNFMNFPPLYRRVRIDTIQIKKNDPKLFQSRLQKFIDNTARGIMYGKWNDNGRLIDY